VSPSVGGDQQLADKHRTMAAILSAMRYGRSWPFGDVRV
jgi:hypothetical protein